MSPHKPPTTDIPKYVNVNGDLPLKFEPTYPQHRAATAAPGGRAPTVPIHTPHSPSPVVGLIQYRDQILVATEDGVWRYDDDAGFFTPLMFEMEADDG